MKIVVDKDIPFINERIDDSQELVYLPGASITREDVKDADAIIVRTRTICDEKLLKNSKVKLVATATIGTDHIDKKWCDENNIIVESAPGCNAPGVAQYVFSSIFNSDFDVKTDILGIVGYGNVGRIVGEWAALMGIKTLVCDPFRKEAGWKDADYKNLETVLEHSDAVTLHVPLSKDGKYPTFKMIGKKELEKMKKNSLIINTSRGGVVDESVIKDYLKAKKINAVTDVWENEPYIDRELLNLSEISTPHIAGYSLEGKKRGTLMVLKALEKHLGIAVKKQDLECETGHKTSITKDIILQSYNPLTDSQILKNNPMDFERLRNNYNYRHEPLFSI